ncbi:MAE_28990/MAE_18760 family HEPN-like nuclease [Candidatus Protofrankia californiensis]|uniref:MAE_28990/MAE_18760 family HEPN-like nuclease n=1 Tax=Candidatus Protofrankia californiensis TaxID=1839754 RepID=UPI0010416009|nr:MAE_28990/MAE_18760 family HEPN-like nuclease [Candidatus Protofrankia californiensis]
MAQRTVNDIADLLDGTLSWRRMELLALGAAIEDAERHANGSPLARALARSGVALLYAHWEGFVKEACQGYVDFVARRRLRLEELNDGFLRTVLLSLSKRAIAGDDVGIDALVDAVRRPTESRARMSKNSIVDTKSNLRFAVLAEIMESVGFEIEPFTTKDKLIDKSLCDNRNSIAHGRSIYPDVGSFNALRDEVLEMMETLRDLILSAVRQQSYRAIPSTQTVPAPRTDETVQT